MGERIFEYTVLSSLGETLCLVLEATLSLNMLVNDNLKKCDEH